MPFRFLKFPIYRDAKALYRMVTKVTESFPRTEKFILTAQLRRAALSVILNIAEGSDRNSDRDFSRYLVHSLGSLNEVVAGLDLSSDLGYLNDQEYLGMRTLATSLSRQLGGFRKKLSH